MSLVPFRRFSQHIRHLQKFLFLSLYHLIYPVYIYLIIGNVGHPLQPVFLRKIDFADARLLPAQVWTVPPPLYAYIVYGNTCHARQNPRFSVLPGGVLLPVQVIRPVASSQSEKDGASIQHFRTQFFILVIVLLDPVLSVTDARLLTASVWSVMLSAPSAPLCAFKTVRGNPLQFSPGRPAIRSALMQSIPTLFASSKALHRVARLYDGVPMRCKGLLLHGLGIDAYPACPRLP